MGPLKCFVLMKEIVSVKRLNINFSYIEGVLKNVWLNVLYCLTNINYCVENIYSNVVFIITLKNSSVFINYYDILVNIIYD